MYPIYRTTFAGRDDFVCQVDAASPVKALEITAARLAIGDYSLDNMTAGRVALCPAHGRSFFYTYTKDSAAQREP